MSHKNGSSKSITQTPAARREEFIAALYSGADPDLWAEIRCIHPETGKANVLWAPVGDQRKLETMLSKADSLNRSGHGIYFGPCLRREKKGSTSAVVSAPALWVDIDCADDPDKRSAALEKLHGFDPPPSIILDSGGGWHAYWLLVEPYVVEDKPKRDQINNILRGLFAAVDGDDEYAKSIASLMRLPGSVNTKPERGGVIASIIEFNPDHRAPISALEWLAVNPQKKKRHRTTTSNKNARAPLPKATLDYIAQGASNGNRNRSLFDAACQFRDAGYSQAEAEQQLIARYVADGAGDENLAAREREAKATITSAYSEVPRDPVAASVPNARKLVSNLVTQFGADEKKNHPTVEQIAEAVRACAHLEAVEWAAQRQRIKDICGNAIRLSDLDKQYRQARKEIERERREEHNESEEYYDEGGQIIYRRETYRGPVEKTVANWVGRVIERISQVNEDGDEEHHAVLELRHDDQVKQLQVPTEVFGDDAALRRFISGKAGEAFTVKAGMGKHLAPAILSLSGNYPQRTCYHFMGWTKIAGRWTYLSPGVSVKSDGVVEDGLAVELSSRLHDYKLQEASWEDSLDAFKAMVPVFPKHLAPTCIAFSLLPVLQGFFPAAAPRPAIHLAGTYGSGKSELAALMSSFYGTFSRDTPPAQWGDTINTVEAVGHPLASALYWVDDYKTIYADERTFTRFLQSYSRGMGRGRLTREAKVKTERPCRGLILSTGETVLEGEASVLSRMLVLDVPPWEHRDPDGMALAEADGLRQHLSGFTTRFAQWVAEQVEEHNIARRLSDEFDVSVKGYRKKLSEAGISMANTGRIILNWSVLVTTYRMLQEFLDEWDAEDILPPWQDVIIETAQTVRQERASEVFISTLEQLLASGDVMLATDMKNPEEPRPGSTLVGYRSEKYIYLLPGITAKAVNRVQPLKFTTAAIGSQLKEDGYLVVTGGDQHLTVQKRIRGNRVRVWRLRSDIFGGDTGDSGDSAQN